MKRGLFRPAKRVLFATSFIPSYCVLLGSPGQDNLCIILTKVGTVTTSGCLVNITWKTQPPGWVMKATSGGAVVSSIDLISYRFFTSSWQEGWSSIYINPSDFSTGTIYLRSGDLVQEFNISLTE